MNEDVLFKQRERTFKQLGTTLEATFKHISWGLDIVDRFEQARDENERELYCAMVVQSVHHSWQTLMKLMRHIAKDVDHDTPKGRGASLALVDRMTQRTSERPSIMGMKHLETARRIGQIHRDYRQAKITDSSASEIIGLLEVMNDDIVPEMMENIRVLALASPGGSKLISYLGPKPVHDDKVIVGNGSQRKPQKAG